MSHVAEFYMQGPMYTASLRLDWCVFLTTLIGIVWLVDTRGVPVTLVAKKSLKFGMSHLVFGEVKSEKKVGEDAVAYGEVNKDDKN